ncbi:flavin-dependent oxidoreductase [Streptomyces sp. I05A-00742]|uniref:flavin-dependent oxidoreductase n=1 Tax=Streptomyces sp. I05A-00742 TaxID=2732853 RepID=UPI001488DDB6|nr:flavin-dependent oxidoreductase [Streptomyces sp. I05A-00742]
MTVLVAGAGIGGLTAALSLHAAGIDAAVVESVREIRPLGVGINLQPHAVRELTELGLGDELAAIGVPPAELVYCDPSGAVLHSEPLGLDRGYRWPQYSVHRGELQLMLLTAVRERLGADAVRTATRLTGFTEDGDTLRVRVLDRRTGGQEVLEAEVLVGADGLHSVTRGLLRTDDDPLLWSGVRMWRGVSPGKPFLTGRSMAIVRDGDAELVAYPIGRDRINWVCLVRVAPPGPLGEDAGWNRPGLLSDVLPHYAGWSLDRLDVPGLLAGADRILEYPMADREPLRSWGRGRVTLLGDAAHPMYPVGANGASQAILDARFLARELARSADVPTALVRYADERREATAAVVHANRAMNQGIEEGAGATGRTATEHYARISDVYRRTTGGDAEALNARPSLTPR